MNGNFFWSNLCKNSNSTSTWFIEQLLWLVKILKLRRHFLLGLENPFQFPVSASISFFPPEYRPFWKGKITNKKDRWDEKTEVILVKKLSKHLSIYPACEVYSLFPALPWLLLSFPNTSWGRSLTGFAVKTVSRDLNSARQWEVLLEFTGRWSQKIE